MKEITVVFKGGETGLHTHGDPMFDDQAGLLVISGGEDASTVITINFDDVRYFGVSPMEEDPYA